MAELEKRHADEVNIAFQMGAEWQRDRMKARIEQLEAALKANEQTIRLALGELSAQDMRNIKSAFKWALLQASERKVE
jgi:hypothetical protein